MRRGKNRGLRRERDGAVALLLSVVAMLLPSALLVFTEQYPPLTALAAILIPAGFYFIWFSLSRRRGLMLAVSLPLIILCALQLVLLYLFGGSIVAVDMFTNILTTNSNEAGELLRNLYPAIIMVVIVYGIPLVCAVIALLRRKTLELSLRRSAAAAGAVLMAAGVAVSSVVDRGGFSVKDHVFPLNVTYNIGRSIKAWNNARNYCKTCRDFTFEAERTSPPAVREVYVMVVGETARACNWELFGYGRNTNPRLSQIRGICPLPRMVTQSNVTHKSVPLMLSSVSAEDFPEIYRRKGIMALFREAGFKTLFISAQSRNKNITDHFATEADSTIYFDDLKGMKYDGDMIPILERAMAADTSDLFVVMHSYGSHYCYNQRYPEEFRHFLPDEEIAVKHANREAIVNAYDNTVLYTDWFLSRVIETIGADSTVCSAMLYCADHGEDLFDDSRCNFLHSSPRTTYYQLHVASLGWFSDRFAALFPEKVEAARANSGNVLTTRYIFHTLAGMASVESPYVNDSFSLTSRSFDSASPLYFLGDRYEPENYLDTGLTEEDVEKFASKGIFLGARTAIPQE